MVWLAAGLSWYFVGSEGLHTTTTEEKAFTTSSSLFPAATGLMVAVILSRIGLWTFDLCARNIIQEEVDETSRGAFSTVEASFQNLFEMLGYITTIVWARADRFRWPALISVAATWSAGGVYMVFVRRRRGHLLHVPDWIREGWPGAWNLLDRFEGCRLEFRSCNE